MMRRINPWLCLAVALAVTSGARPVAAARRCLTVGWRQLRGEGRVLWAAPRPRFDISLASAKGYPFLVHGPSDAMPLMERIRDAADRAWEAEIELGGWPAPPPDNGGPDDRFDIYIDPRLGAEEAYVGYEDEVPETPWDDATSYMGLPNANPDDDTLFSYVAHELNHASHFAIDAAEDDAFYEHTAVLVEQRVAGHVPTYAVGIADYQSHPERAIDYYFGDYNEYGAALWLMFLSEHVGGGSDELVRRLWIDGKQETADWTNEPDFIDTLGPLLADKGWSRARFFATFASWRYFTGSRDDGRHFADGARWGESSLAPVSRHALGAGEITVAASVGAMGTHLAEIELPPGATVVQVSVAGDAPAAAVVGLDASGAALGAPRIAEPGTVAALPVDGNVSLLLLALTRVPPSYDPEDDDWSTHGVSATLAAMFGTAEDGGAGSPDAGASDAGTFDAGAPPDAGFSPDASISVDGGPSPDGGPEPDAAANEDAGFEPDASLIADAGPAPDAGGVPDAAVAQDAGTTTADAADVPDSGFVSDASAGDAGGGPGPDAGDGAAPLGSSGGCAFATAGENQGWAWFLCLGFLLWCRRRRLPSHSTPKSNSN